MKKNMYTKEDVKTIDDYIVKTYGEYSYTWKEKITNDFSVCFVVVAPPTFTIRSSAFDKPIKAAMKEDYKLITVGYGTHSMFKDTPIELSMTLSSDWAFFQESIKDEVRRHPIELLKRLILYSIIVNKSFEDGESYDVKGMYNNKIGVDKICFKYDELDNSGCILSDGRIVRFLEVKCLFDDEREYFTYSIGLSKIELYQALLKTELFNKKKTTNKLVDEGSKMHDGDYMEIFQKYVKKTFGEISYIYHEKKSDKVHIDVLVISPSEERDYYTLITMGAGSVKMPNNKRAELMIKVPSYWKLDYESIKDEKWGWVIYTLKSFAREPIDKKSSLRAGDICWFQEPYEGTDFEYSVLLRPHECSKKKVVLNNGEKVDIFQFIPLYSEELAPTKRFKKDKDEIDKYLKYAGIADPKRGKLKNKR